MINEMGHVKLMPKLLSSVKDNVVNLTGGSIGIGIPTLNLFRGKLLCMTYFLMGLYGLQRTELK